ncbi:hydrocephalus-inducing protein homolog, partial [Leptonychotes weddellii]|uniref:Hydrocephalus-inducing protein homolog n=1 Tax=Leptonychotes weddellii TaxID=9713 RepID=A0A2U3YSX3_LEPWE
EGDVWPNSSAEITVYFNPLEARLYQQTVYCDISGKDFLYVEIVEDVPCIVPTLHMVNPEVDFGHCFLKYPYEKTVQLVNHDDLPGCYTVLPQVYGDTPAVLLSSPMPCGVIPPHSTVHIPLALETQVTGEYRSTVYISTFGSPDPPMVCRIKSIGEGPVIYVHPTQVDFGNIYVLKDSPRILNLSNQSFIPALFQARMAHTKSLWTIEPSKGMVPPETDVQLTLTANLNDILTFKDTVILDIENSNTYRIPVQASGVGSTIVSDKPFAPELNLGAHFSLDTYFYRFKLTNKGRRVQQLFWMNEDFCPQDKLSKKGLAKKGLAKSQPQPQCSQESRAPPGPVFQLHPVRMELYPDQTIDVMLEGYSATPRVRGHLLLQKPNTILEPDYQPLVMKNISTLPVNVLLSTSRPFFICESDKSPLPLTPEPIKLEIDGEKNLLVKFDPSYRNDLNNWMAEEILAIKYMEHPQVDSLNLRGEVNYPNLSFETMELDFGCILNDTEVIRYVTITNCSPLVVKFRWFFLVDNEENQIRFVSWPRKAYSAPLSQVESIPVISASASSPAVPAIESPEMDLNDFVKTVLTDEDVGCEEREYKEVQVPTVVISDGLKFNSAETEKTDPNLSQVEFQEPPWIFEREEMLSIGIEEVFDILPLYGVLRPHSSHQISFTFYGHCDITAQAKALCEVEGGPTYEIMLRGEASLVNYSFDTKDINYGLQLFDHVTEKEITLRNTGKVGFEFKVLTDHLSSPDNLLPGAPLILPLSGFISSHQEQVLKVYYLPGVPEVFQRSFQIQIAHLDPENITLRGEGIFPRICLDLPRKLHGNKKYETFLNQARKNLEKEHNKYETLIDLETTEEMPEDESSELSPQLQMEVERLIVQGYAIEHQKTIIPDSTDDFSYRSRRKLAKVQLPEYILDFGYIILGDVRTHIIKITNTSHFPVSFHAEKRILHDTGFSTELDRVKNLPYCETETFEVKFDPQGASLPVGNKEVILPIKVVGGPTIHICLQAKVTIPTMTLSCGKVEFATIQCGQCLMETVQFSNPLQVPCEWFVHSHKPVNKLEKHMPKYLRRKLHAELKPKTRIFEIQPMSGVLGPGERSNVQVKFMPKEEKFYSQTLVFQIAQSAQKLTLLAQGQGLEPCLAFSPSVLELGPLLPYAPGDEAEVVVKNPCSFPIEFYSLEFDQQYLLEEKILRTLKGYDPYNTLLLPPRLPGEKLPPELYEYFKEMKRSKEEQMKAKYLESLVQENEEEDGPSSDLGTSASTKRTSLSLGISVTSNLEERHLPMMESKTYPDEEEDEESLEKITFQTDKLQSIDSHSTEEVGEVENNPVSKAIARHLGIDISAEGRMAKNRKGIAIVVHGTPLAGKTATAISMAKYYNAACLNIDSIVLEAISDGNNIPGIRARELCIRAAIEQSIKEGEESAQEAASGQTAVGQIRLSSETLGKLTSESTLVTPEFKPTKTVRGSMMIAKSKTESHGSGSQKQHHQHASETPQVSSSPLPTGPTQCRLSVSPSVGGETGLMSCVLPEDLLTQILAERIQLSDCFRGVVFDSLETLFAQNIAVALLCLLKAIGNRDHIYVVNMAQEYTAMKAQEKAKKEQEEHKRREALEKEKERLQNMDEEEYDAMTEEEKIMFNREVQQALRERKKRELERLTREMREKKLQQELERQKEEDELKRKVKRPKHRPVKEEPLPKKSQTNRQVLTFSKLEVKMDALERKVSVREHLNEKDDLSKRRKNQLGDIHMLGFPLAQEQEDSEGDLLKDADKHLAQKFKTYELTLKDIQNILMNWDRKQGILVHHTGAEDMPHEPDDQRQVPSGGRRGRKDRERERAEKERAEKERQEREKAERERLEKLRALEERSDGGEGEGGEEDHHEGKKDLGVPFITVQTPDFEGLSWKLALENDRLPKGDQILDILGLGSSGPPIPPPALFSIISYPLKRLPLTTTEILKHFVFVIPPSEELSLLEEKREGEAETELSGTVGSGKTQEEQTTSSKGSRQKPKEKADQARDTQKDKRRMAFNRKGLSGGTAGVIAPLSDMDQNNFAGQLSQEKFIRLNHFRWIVPANGEVTLRIHFSSNELGNFDQTFNFEILGTHRQYQLYCRGVCSYPYICQDPKVVFTQRKMDIKQNEVIFKKYVMRMEKFYFGPLLCGKSRDKYKSSLFPGNMETLTILNNSPMVVEAFFCFQNDVKASTYFLEPVNMTLKPSEKQVLNVWAYPTAVGVFDDCIVCCIKENPEPAVFKLTCQGVRPELELDSRQLHFDRLLLHRKDSKVVLLRNVTPLPVAWRITSLEHLGDDFTVSTMQGTIPPKAEYSLQVHFQPSKPVNIKKVIRLEVLDADNLIGVVQIENILVFAESYDVALDITFPKGAEGGLDFGIVKVMEEAKQPLQLKNRGKYEIMFSFSVDSLGILATNVNSMISVQPKKGSLTSTEKPTTVQVLFRAKKEVKIEHQPVLRCQIIEPSITEGGEIIASIPIKFSVNAVYSKYNISPSAIINFGALICGTRKSTTFTIENQGVTDFKYALYRLTGESPIHQKKAVSHVRHARSRESENFYKASPSKAAKFSDAVQKEVNITNQVRFTHGMFTVYPGFGSIPSGGTQVITVDCVADPVGRCEEFIAIDISDRDPRDQPAGIPYSLLAEACLPAFVTDNNALIFEEHQICSSTTLLNILQTIENGGLFVEDENKFIFCNVLVGHQAKARFKISNVGKIACDVNIVVKPISNKLIARITDIFDVEPNKMCVASRSHAFATVTFTPQTMQTYQCIFEATLDGLPSNLTRNRSLVFDIVGEGNLPRVTIVRPVLCNQYGNPLLLFRRLLLGQSEKLPLILKNNGTIPAQLHVDLRDQLGVFSLKGTLTTSYIYITEENKPHAKAKKAHTASLVVPPGNTAGFDVVFQSQKVGRMAGTIHLSVINNQYEETIIHMVGEGYEDDITLGNIHGLVVSSSPEAPEISEIIEENTMEDLVAAALVDHIQFGDCHIGNSYNVSFTITNHSQVNVIRFEWPPVATVSFSPQRISSAEMVARLMLRNSMEACMDEDRSQSSHPRVQTCVPQGREARETVHIINKEEQGFHFAFQDNSRYSEGFSNSLVIRPMEGWIPPLSRFPVDIFFTPKQEGDVNFNLICNVKKKAHPLTLNVKAEGYTMNAEVKCKDRTGLITLLTPKETNIINFYEVELNECVQCELSFINTGKFNFSFQAELSGPKALLQYLEFSPIDGSVDVGQSAHASLSFQPFKKCVLKGLELRIKISHGPTFLCSISGCAVSPAVHFSFTSYNFGTCFIYQAGMPPYKQILVVTNKEETSMSLDCLYTNTPYLEVNFRVDVIKPGKTLEIPITFYPRESIQYRELIPFEINGLSQQIIEIKGKGTEMKISVLDPSNRIVKLGAVLPGQVVKKTVSIMNTSHTHLTFSQSVLFSIPELQEPKVITLIPFHNITLKPKEVCKLEVIFAPKKRIPPFSEEVFMECMGLLRPLFLLSGCCQALEISLDQEHLPFGPVVYQTQATRRILMLNTGDVGARFKWDVKKFEPHFSISPEEGYITAGMEVSFEVTYHPTEVGKESLYKNLLCFIQGGNPLSLTLSGVCVGPPAVKEVVNFTCQVRSKHTQTILLSNRTNQTWNLHPIFEGEHWEGPEFITLEPHQQNKPYEITYRPRTMNLENRKHQGTLFFPLPDGTGWLYMLHGVAELPKAVANIFREVPCKTPYVELLPISNWLNKPQRFRVIVEMIKPEKPDLSVTLKGLDYIDVLSGSKKDYKLNFFSHKEGLYSAKVIFRNEVTNEFLHYMVSFRVIPSGIIKTIEMTSPVRQSTSASIKVENPLPYLVTFSTECRVPDISLPSQFMVPANSEGTFSFEFQPLRAGETFGRLMLHNSDLGYYLYELSLKATPALPEKPIHFQAILGSGQSIFAKFTNYTRQKTEYYCRTDCQDFHTEKIINAAPGAQGGTEVSVEVYFEPSHLGETKGILMLSSITGGEYIIPLFGVALPPKPQGPFLIRAGYNIVIPFKNIFYHPVTFSFIVENPAFSVRAVDSVRPKKINNITVSFEGNPSGSKTPITSKLIVSCPPSEGNEAGVKWVYYLKGITP